VRYARQEFWWFGRGFGRLPLAATDAFWVK